MHPFAYVLILAYFVMALVASSLSSTVERAAHAQRMSIAGSIAIYAKVASDYAKAHPSIDAAISPAVLAAPEWFNRNSRVSAYALNGIAYVYYSTAESDEAGQIARACPKGVRCTVVMNGTMYEPGSLAAFASVPTGRGLPFNNAVMLRF